MTIDVPFMVVSYGDFAKTKKLFYYERNGVCQWPVFTDASKTEIFIQKMHDALLECGDDRKLSIQICADRLKAIEMFEVIMTHITQLRFVSINPQANDDDELIDIEECLKMLQSSEAKQVKLTSSS